jgi:hypothetical protein
VVLDSAALEVELETALVVVATELVEELAVDETLLDPALCPAATGHPLFTRHDVFALLTAIEPPTPPPTAAAIMTIISASRSQNVAARKPKIVCSLGLASVYVFDGA